LGKGVINPESKKRGVFQKDSIIRVRHATKARQVWYNGNRWEFLSAVLARIKIPVA